MYSLAVAKTSLPHLVQLRAKPHRFQLLETCSHVHDTQAGVSWVLTWLQQNLKQFRDMSGSFPQTKSMTSWRQVSDGVDKGSTRAAAPEFCDANLSLHCLCPAVPTESNASLLLTTTVGWPLLRAMTKGNDTHDQILSLEIVFSPRQNAYFATSMLRWCCPEQVFKIVAGEEATMASRPVCCFFICSGHDKTEFCDANAVGIRSHEMERGA